ncbi:MAG: endonuclease V [Nanohaloarchaea archaeon]|nr:endonuclease V [Candidatus Nanohaloarchaea archaeon]
MRITNEKFLPEKASNREEMEELQRKISSKALSKDSKCFNAENVRDKMVVGIDQAFLDEKAFSAAVAMKDGEVIEKVHGVSELKMPYIPGLLAFREMPSMVAALDKLHIEPDLLMLDGSGHIHFREAGIATHVGVLYDKPSIGVAKNLLCGRTTGKVDNLEQGERVPIQADSKVETANESTIGYSFQSRQYPKSKRINPLYISPGHRVSAETSVDIVQELCDGYKLPEPTRLADKYVSETKNISS